MQVWGARLTYGLRRPQLIGEPNFGKTLNSCNGYPKQLRRAEWPTADFIVGNPPFIGKLKLREALGDGYVEALRNSWKDVPDSADFVMYWWDHAASLVRAGAARRFGFITTNSLRQTFNRRVIESHLSASKNPLTLAFAVPDHPWVDSAQGAAVRIAMSVGTAAEEERLLLGVLSSQVHIDWALAAGRRLGVGNDPRYNKSRCFEPFPFPCDDTGLTPELADRIRSLAEQLDAHRKARQAAFESVTLTWLYNVLDKLRRGEALTAKDKTLHEQGLVSVLQSLHNELDAAALAAYGWSDLGPVPWADDAARAAWTETLLERLVALNAKRAAEEAAGTVRWLRPEFQDPARRASRCRCLRAERRARHVRRCSQCSALARHRARAGARRGAGAAGQPRAAGAGRHRSGLQRQRPLEKRLAPHFEDLGSAGPRAAREWRLAGVKA